MAAQLAANAADDATQELRYAALKGKKVLLLSATYMIDDSVTDVSRMCESVQETFSVR